jgi:protein AroM
VQTIALVTIGQSPREDIVDSMYAGATPARLIECGALDTLESDEIAELRPRDGEHPLVSRLRDGSEAVIAKERLMPHMQAAVDRAVRDGATLAVILCTGEFTQLSIPVPAIYPDRVLAHVVEAVLPAGTVGVLLPHAGQMATMRQKWTTSTRTFAGSVVSPYTARDELARQAQELRQAGAQLIVMDCMGFDREMKRTVAEASGLPTILANRMVGRVVEELTSSGNCD